MRIALLGALLVIGCGESEEQKAASKLRGELRNKALGYSLRYPADWRGGKGGQDNDVRALQGSGGRECIVVPDFGLPDWSSEASRRRYYERRARERRLEVRSTGAVDGQNAEGVTAVTSARSGAKRRLVRSATFASGGVGVTLSCSAPEDAFERADREAFRPMVASVRIRRNEQAEELQPKLAQLEGVTAAGVLVADRRAQAQLRLSRREAGLPAVKETLRLLVSELDAERVGVQAFERPANPVIATWDARTGRAFVQAIPNPPERYRLED
jgi:hypothetical protein